MWFDKIQQMLIYKLFPFTVSSFYLQFLGSSYTHIDIPNVNFINANNSLSYSAYTSYLAIMKQLNSNTASFKLKKLWHFYILNNYEYLRLEYVKMFKAFH